MTLRGRLAALLLYLLPILAAAQAPTDDFDARPLAMRDIQSLQAALALQGHYTGLIDGKWGAGSQSALEGFASARGRPLPPTYSDAGLALDRLDRAFVRDRWEQLGPDNGPLTLMAPTGLFARSVEDDGHFTLETASRDLLVRILGEPNATTVDMHVWLERNHVGPQEFYRLIDDGTVISAAILDSGKSAYLRSTIVSDGWLSVLIQASPDHRGRAALMVASLRAGPQPRYGLRDGSPLHRILNPTRPAPDRAARTRPSQPRSDPPGLPVRATGSAFYVNNTDLVTAEHVVDGCRSVRLGDGTPLRIIARDVRADLAVVSSPRRSDTWLSIDPRAAPVLGERSFALGFPYFGRFDQGLSVTSGNISALPSSGDPKASITISAPVQPGNSGGPLLNRTGEVVGVVIARASDIASLVDEGSLPQNINFATPVSALRRFLKDNRIFYTPDGTDGIDLDSGVPIAMQRAVATVFCQ